LVGIQGAADAREADAGETDDRGFQKHESSGWLVC